MADPPALVATTARQITRPTSPSEKPPPAGNDVVVEVEVCVVEEGVVVAVVVGDGVVVVTVVGVEVVVAKVVEGGRVVVTTVVTVGVVVTTVVGRGVVGAGVVFGVVVPWATHVPVLGSAIAPGYAVAQRSQGSHPKGQPCTQQVSELP